MDDSMPVFLDYNEEDINTVLTILENIESEAGNINVYGPSNCLYGELNSKIGLGEIPNSNIRYLDKYARTLKSRISTSVNRVKYIDIQSRNKLRDYVSKILDYTKPIDRGKYSHLSEELIEMIYNERLRETDIGRNKYREYLPYVSSDEEKKELFKLILSSPVHVFEYDDASELYQIMDDEERKEMCRLLNYSRIMTNYRIGNIIYSIGTDEFINIKEKTSSNSLYDENTLLTFALAKNHQSDFINANEILSLKFGEVVINVNSSQVAKYCSEQYIDYYGFFRNTLGNDIPDDKIIFFDLNGVEVNVPIKIIKDAISLDTVGQSGFGLVANNGQYLKNVLETQYENLTKFMGSLINAGAFSKEEMEKEQKIFLYGKYINTSLEKLSKYFNSDNTFDIYGFVDNEKLSEYEYIYYYDYLNDSVLYLEYLDIHSNPYFLDWFKTHGNINQGEISNLIFRNDQNEIDKLTKFGSNKYGLTEDEVYVIMNSLDSVGACTYAATCNAIYEMYGFDNEKFEKDFGYSMMDPSLLLDLYISANIGSKENGDNTLILKDVNGNLQINRDLLLSDSLINANKQKYMEYDKYSKGTESLEEFLQANNSKILDNRNIETVKVQTEDEHSLDKLKQAIDNKNAAVMSIYDDYEMYEIITSGSDTNTYYGSYKNAYSSNQSGHKVTPVAYTEEGFIVLSWGKMYYVPFEDCYDYTIFETKEKTMYDNIPSFVSIAP